MVVRFGQGGGHKVFIHVGLMKTGSTFLQRQVIPKLGICHFNDQKRVGPGPVDALRPLFDRKWTKTTSDKAKIKLLNSAKKNDGGPDIEKTLLSWEGLLGNPCVGNLNQAEAAGWVKEVFPNAKILITIRRQDNFAESVYIQTIHNYRWGDVDSFLSRVEGKFSHYTYTRPIRAGELTPKYLFLT